MRQVDVEVVLRGLENGFCNPKQWASSEWIAGGESWSRPKSQDPVRMTCSGVWLVNDKGGLHSLSMMLQQNT
jgi:hypothetical protein